MTGLTNLEVMEMAQEESLDTTLVRALAMANGCMLQALAATHPAPDNLRQAFDEQTAKFLASLNDRAFRGAVEMQVKDLRKHIPGGTV